MTRVASPTAPSAPSAAPAEKKPIELVAIGQHRESYILASGPEGLLVIDQHAAHERILYERIRDRIASGRVLSQKLLMRALFEAAPEEVETLTAAYEDLEAAGFEVEPMSGRSYAIAALPAETANRDPADTLHEALAALVEPGNGESVPRRDRLAAGLACRRPLHLPPRPPRRPFHDGRGSREVLQAALSKIPLPPGEGEGLSSCEVACPRRSRARCACGGRGR